ncbi:hypothetical protein CDAR_475401 [Caerostris darwini]|uniref:Uncharacterized protein n=1 Tax=Caerostris darwini TaxID=1538125 RepID=A0AAV4PCX4_9ARAC|nr:hypothetical protein CDAR_475401 [Caerostris darwini]
MDVRVSRPLNSTLVKRKQTRKPIDFPIFLIAKKFPQLKEDFFRFTSESNLGVDAVGTRVSVLDLSEDFALMSSLTTAGAITCQMCFLKPLCLFLFKTALLLYAVWSYTHLIFEKIFRFLGGLNVSL